MFIAQDEQVGVWSFLDDDRSRTDRPLTKNTKVANIHRSYYSSRRVCADVRLPYRLDGGPGQMRRVGRLLRRRSAVETPGSSWTPQREGCSLSQRSDLCVNTGL